MPKRVLCALALVILPYLFTSACLAQTMPATPGNLPTFTGSDPNLSQTAAQTAQPTSQSYGNAALRDQLIQQSAQKGLAGEEVNVTDTLRGDAAFRDSLIKQAAEQGQAGDVLNATNALKEAFAPLGYNDTYDGLHQWFSNDIVSNLFANMWQLIGKWISEFINGWVADTVQVLTAFLRTFVLNPNIAVNGLNGGFGQNGQPDDISPYIRQGADVMYGIAVDLLLLLFILCIWKYWAEAAWRGGGNIMGAVARMIFTAGLLLAWPTIYAFEVQITNEMIKAIFFSSADQVIQLDSAMASAVKGGLVMAFGLTAQAFAQVIAPVAGGAAATGAGGALLGTVGDMVAFAGLVIYLILGVILITQLVYFLILKSIQVALLTAQYMFAPIFLVFFATPDTESITAGYVRAFVEVSLWTFVWVGQLRIMVIILFSDFNPWGKIVMAIGILQLMIQVPAFLSKAQISPMSDFISAGMMTGGLLSGAKALGAAAQSRAGQFFSYILNDQYAARGLAKSQAVELGGIPTGAANPELLNQFRQAYHGDGKGGKAGGPPKKDDPNGPAPAPGLATPGGATGPETEEQRRARLAREQAAMQTASGRALNTPGVRNAQAAWTGVVAAVASNLATPAAGAASAVDPTTNPPADLLQSNPADAEGGKPHVPFNPLSRYAETGRKGMPLFGIAKDIRTAAKGITYSSDGSNRLTGEIGGDVKSVQVRKGATPEEIAHMIMASAYTGLYKDNPAAGDAARQAAIDAGEDAPRGMLERMGAGYLAYTGSTFKKTNMAKQRFSQALFSQAALGSEAYVSGRQGNAYTHYLRRRFGDWDSESDSYMTFQLTEESSSESPWNPAGQSAVDNLVQSGQMVTPMHKAVAMHPHVMKLRPNERRMAIEGGKAYIEKVVGAEYPDAPEKVRFAAASRIAQRMTPAQVMACHAIYSESGSDGMDVPMVEAVARISANANSRGAAEAYKNVQVHLGQAASNGVAPARRLVEVERVVNSMYDAGFNDKQIQDAAIAKIAHPYALAGNSHMLSTAAVTARVMVNPQYINDDTVQIVDKMISSGHNPNQIERPQVWAAIDLDQNNLAVTPNNVKVLIEQADYSPSERPQTLSSGQIQAIQAAQNRINRNTRRQP